MFAFAFDFVCVCWRVFACSCLFVFSMANFVCILFRLKIRLASCVRQRAFCCKQWLPTCFVCGGSGIFFVTLSFRVLSFRVFFFFAISCFVIFFAVFLFVVIVVFMVVLIVFRHVVGLFSCFFFGC